MADEHAGGEEWRTMESCAALGNSEESASVVAAAKRRIRSIRMRDVELRVVDRDNRPVVGLPVEIVQLKQAFPFGEQLWGLDRMFRFGEHETDKARYFRLRFTELLNAANALCYWTERPRNDGPKVEDLQGRNTLEGFEYCVDWARAYGLTVKGHPLFWSIPKAVPEWVKRYDYETQLKFLEVRVRNIVSRFRGRVAMWDAVNEPMWEPAFRNLPKRRWPHLDPIDEIADYIELVLRWCREEDPDACYLVNDYGLEADPDNGPPRAVDGTEVTAKLQRQRFLALIDTLGARGAAPGAVGLQSHTGRWLSPPDQVALYDEMAATCLPIHITEFWADVRHLKREGRLPQDVIDEMQAEYVVNYLTCAFGHPAVEAFFFWGLMDSAIEWREASSHELKPLYSRLQHLIHEEWTTRQSAVTNAQGMVRLRAFYGDYALRFSLAPGVQQGARFTVDRQQGMPLTLIVEAGPLK